MFDDATVSSAMNAEEVNRLFDLLLHRRRKTEPRFGEYALFQEVLGNGPETDAAFSRFLHDVESCPKTIIEKIQHVLATGTVQT